MQILMTRDYVYLLRTGIVDWRNVDCYYAVYNMKMDKIIIVSLLFFQSMKILNFYTFVMLINQVQVYFNF